ncbi:hypothetical protein BS50DRAFT_608997 [Corynespora cassiicola Philippines]|uniref:Zn(2)-C6 fungal-type domain-containing protein n=1 Tax=Corynespora cassiicola Philippines TaxID=1448308 RepID=A0A2T2NTX3_CORCC|nr:hypothetical protein BS50DRAFT_608997 [Corynespora cassiicola Philippines]
MDSDARTPPHRVVPPSRRRDKPILSCSLCRRRKLKCDRQQPCKTCQDRGLSLSCTYAQYPSKSAARDAKAPANVHERIDQLEKLVSTLLGSKNQPPEDCHTVAARAEPSVSDHTNDEEESPAVPNTPARVKLANDATSYTSSGHWSSILDGIAELRGELDEINVSEESKSLKENEPPGPDLLFGRHRHTTKEELLAALPLRAEADELLAIYFDNMDMAPCLIHKPTFIREYAQFWEHPFETPVMWIGLLYSLFALATRFQAVLNNESNINAEDPSDAFFGMTSARMDYYREKIVQCLVLANYSKAPPYTVETLIHYFVAEYFRSRDAQFGTWLLVGIIVRVAFRMGYHREPSRFANISPFKAEMRRRVWVMVVQLDLMSSTQFGLPRMIQPSMYDTREPHNLSEGDLDEHMTELPPARPETEFTTMLYTIIRNRVLEVFAKINDVTNETAQPAYREILELAASLRGIHERLPDNLKRIRIINFESSSDETSTMRRLYLGLTLLKACIVLHRPYLVLARSDSRYEYSRMMCIDAAMEVLEYQKEIEVHARPGGRLWMGKWRLWAMSWRLSSIVNHDFLLATTVLAVDLDKDLTSPFDHSEEDAPRIRFMSGQPSRAEIVDALLSTYPIWCQASQKSSEARKVTAAVRYVLRKASVDIESTSTQPSPSQSSGHEDFVQQFDPQNFHVTDGGLPPNFNFQSASFAPQFNMTDASVDFGAPFDWGGLETNFGMPSFDQPLPESYIS